MNMDFVTIVCAVIAVALLARLWSLLGTRSEDEPLRPNPFVPPPVVEPEAASSHAPAPLRQVAGPPPESVAGGLAQVKAVDAAFDEKAFLQAARVIFTSVVEAYATGNLAGVSAMLAPDLRAHFQQAVDTRKAAGQVAQTRVVRISEAETVSARAEGTRVLVSVKFVSDQENILRDARGTILGGSEGKTEEVTDIWVFARDTQTVDASWVVVETRG